MAAASDLIWHSPASQEAPLDSSMTNSQAKEGGVVALPLSHSVAGQVISLFCH